MNICYLCKEILTSENYSKEHIILNSIGGRLKSSELLCKSCNSILGHEADSELANQLAFLASFLQIKRDKGEPQIIKGGKTKDGTIYNLVNGVKPILSKPTFRKTIEHGETKYLINARNEKEMLNILKGLKKDHPKMDIEQIKLQFQYRKEYLDEPLHYQLTIGGDLALRSITKTAVNYYIYTQKNTTQVEHLFSYLKAKTNLRIAKHYYSIKPVYKKDSNEIIHLIHLEGGKNEKLLFAYIEFFSSYSFIILLSDNYIGKSFKSTYAYDLINYKQIDKVVSIKISTHQLHEIPLLSPTDFKIIKDRLDRLMRIAQTKHTNTAQSDLIRDTVTDVFGRYKHEPVITQEMVNVLSKELAEAYVKFAYRGLLKKRVSPL
jgi:hypothetical protein